MGFNGWLDGIDMESNGWLMMNGIECDPKIEQPHYMDPKHV